MGWDSRRTSFSVHCQGRVLTRWSLLALLMLASVVLIGPTADAGAANEPPVPPAQEIEAMLTREPISLATWPVWRERLLAWQPDRSIRTDPAYEAAATFLRGQTDSDGNLLGALNSDYFAWQQLGNSYLLDGRQGNKLQAARKMEYACRKSIELEPEYARGHRSLALALLLQPQVVNGVSPLAAEAKSEVLRAGQLDPSLKFKGLYGFAALWNNDFAAAERWYTDALAEDPDDLRSAYSLASACVQNQSHVGLRAPVIAPLAARHPDDGGLICFHGLALAIDGQPREGLKEFQKARRLGFEPETVIGPSIIAQIELAARPGLVEIAMYVGIGFLVIYGAVMVAMAVAGLVLGSFTRGSGALKLLPDRPMEVLSGGHVVRSSGEPWLARIYGVCLVCGLILFYIALPFVAVGILFLTLGALWLIFQAKRIPVKLVIIIIVVGLGMVWAVIKSMFARMGTGAFGLAKTEAQCPRLFSTLREVADRVDTNPVDEVYLAPGSDIGVHQEGRGPWGMFGTKRRVLTLGLATLRTLTIAELKSILAHEYAHFSHQDTFYSRFIHRVDLSIHTALMGMAAAGGKLNYVNPFYWFLYLYYRAYSLLSAGFSRSREYLADRMACSLYGSNVFTSSLTKVCLDGTLFENTMYGAVHGLLTEGQAYKNMYQAFADYRTGASSEEERDKIRKSIDEDRSSFFASHPALRERLKAIENYPPGTDNDPRPAIELFDDPAALEGELTCFLTAVMHNAQQQAAAEAAAQS